MPPHRSASLRAALAPPCPGATARVTSPSAGCPALAAGRRTRRANAPHRSRSCWRRLNRCSQPRAFARRASIRHRGCKMYIATHTPNPWRARSDDLAPRGLLAGLPRAFGTWVPAAPFSGLAASLRPASPSKQEEAPGSLSPNASFRQRQPASGPFLGMPLWQAASPPPCRAPWRCPAWRSRDQAGYRQP